MVVRKKIDAHDRRAPALINLTGADAENKMPTPGPGSDWPGAKVLISAPGEAGYLIF
jgi:hypothetical protein